MHEASPGCRFVLLGKCSACAVFLIFPLCFCSRAFVSSSCPQINPAQAAVYFPDKCLLAQNFCDKSCSLLSHVSPQVAAPSFGPVKTHELLHHMTGKGLSAKYHFPRQPCLYQPSMVAVQVILTNSSDHGLEEIHVGDQSPASLDIHCFNTIGEYWCHTYQVLNC